MDFHICLCPAHLARPAYRNYQNALARKNLLRHIGLRRSSNQRAAHRFELTGRERVAHIYAPSHTRTPWGSAPPWVLHPGYNDVQETEGKAPPLPSLCQNDRLALRRKAVPGRTRCPNHGGLSTGARTKAGRKRHLKRLSDENMKVQIELGFTAAERAAGRPIAPFFRYPYLSHTQSAAAYLRSRYIAQFAIDIDSFDWRTRNAESVTRRVMASLEHRGRGIILLHDIHPSTAAAVPAMLARLKANGFKVVHLRPKSAVETVAAYEAPRKERRHVPLRRPSVAPSLTGWKWPHGNSCQVCGRISSAVG